MSGAPSQSSISLSRLREARRVGYSPRSPELTLGVVLLTAAWVGQDSFPAIGQCLQLLMQVSISDAGTGAGHFELPRVTVLWPIGRELLRLFFACWTAAMVSDLAQVGFLWNPVTVTPQLERFSPLAGATRLLSWMTWERGLLLSLKCLVTFMSLGVLIDWAIRALALASGEGTDLSDIWVTGSKAICLTFATVGVCCVLSGTFDAWIRQSRWRFSLQQTDDERRYS